MLDGIRKFRDGGTISRELKQLGEVARYVNGLPNNFYNGLRNRSRQFRELVENRHGVGIERRLLQYMTKTALHSYQYAMLKYPHLHLAAINYPEGNIAGSLDTLFEDNEGATAFIDSLQRPISRSKPLRYAPLPGLLQGTMKHLDIGGGMIPSAFYLHSGHSSIDLARIRKTHELANPEVKLTLAQTVSLDIQKPDRDWGLACSVAFQRDIRNGLLTSNHRLDATMEAEERNEKCGTDSDNIFTMSNAKFDLHYREKHNVVSTFFVIDQSGYHPNEWAARIAQILPVGGIWLTGGNETYDNVSETYPVFMYRKSWTGEMHHAGEFWDIHREPVYSLGLDTENSAFVYPKGRRFFSEPYTLPKV